MGPTLRRRALLSSVVDGLHKPQFFENKGDMNTPMKTTSTTAIVSLVFGIICWIAIPFIGAIVAVICGHVARGEIRSAPPGTIEGDGMAVAGLILGYAHLILFALAMMLVFMFLGGLAFFAHWHW